MLAMIGIVVAMAAPARAAGWADALFSERAHDFGPVARGATVRHPFVLTNRLSEPVTILDVRASCGCTTGWANASMVQPGQSAVVEAQMDTRNFVGRKETVLYVSLVTGSGRQGEARLGVSSMILSDVVLNPGSLDFGVVSRGQTPSLTLSIDRLGQPQWRVQRMVSGCRAIDASLVEAYRSAAGVGYRMTVVMKADAPAGAFRDEIRVITNDAESPVIPVLVTGSIRGDLTATPTHVALGEVAPTASVQGRFLVRADRPFTIRGIEGSGDGFKATVDDGEAKPVHVVTVAYRPEEATIRGDLRRVFRVFSDLPGEAPVDLTLTLHVNP
jgi:hypothetical protein